MVKKTGPTDRNKRELIVKLERTKIPVWKEVAERLSCPRRDKVTMNLKRIDRYADEGETIVVPGSVLGTGTLSKAVNVSAWKFSPSAEEKIRGAKGKAISIEELLEENPKGSKVRIMV